MKWLGTIFVDETMVKIRRVRSASRRPYKPELRAFLWFRVSYNQSSLDAYPLSEGAEGEIQ